MRSAKEVNDARRSHRQVYVLRGLSGSGKTTLARKLTQQKGHERSTIVSADHFFETLANGYHFDPAKFGEAHASCFREFLWALAKGHSPVIVDNTSISAVEIAPYMLGAAAYGYDAEILEVFSRLHIDQLTECAMRNTHGVPLATILRQAALLGAEEPLPRYWLSRMLSYPFEEVK